MSKIPIRGKTPIDDASHRYMMERFKISDEKGKTVINNIDKVASDIKCDVILLISFLKKRLATSINRTEKPAKSSKYVTTLNKKISLAELEDKLFDFIQTCILCPKCNAPELVLEQDKKNISRKCMACTHNDSVSSI